MLQLSFTPIVALMTAYLRLAVCWYIYDKVSNEDTDVVLDHRSWSDCVRRQTEHAQRCSISVCFKENLKVSRGVGPLSAPSSGGELRCLCCCNRPVVTTQRRAEGKNIALIQRQHAINHIVDDSLDHRYA